MAEKKIPETLQMEETARDSYATKVFKESSVNFVSSVAKITTIGRKVFKVTAFILCFAGFLYQSGKFLEGFFKYPTSVTIDIVRPDRYNAPAYTFCDNNVISRTMFCQKYPDYCEKPSAAFCKKYSFYCSGSDTMVPKIDSYTMAAKLNMEDMIDLNVNVNKFVRVESQSTIGDQPKENISGPFWRVSNILLPGFLCYSLNDRVDNSLLPVETKRNDLIPEPVSVLHFTVRPYETFFPQSRPGILFAIHSPFQAVNPFETGVFMEPGRTYMVFVSMEEEVLLKEPYDTKCVNYTERWEKNGYSGPREQEMCKQECFADISMKCYNCVIPMCRFPTKNRYCTQDDIRNISGCDQEDEDELMTQCNSKCRDDCRRIKYDFTVRERFTFRDISEQEKRDNVTIDNLIRVEIYIESDELVVLKHAPKYMVVEVFSNIGGFIGIWLGINILDVTDIFEGLFRIVKYSLKKK